MTSSQGLWAVCLLLTWLWMCCKIKLRRNSQAEETSENQIWWRFQTNKEIRNKLFDLTEEFTSINHKQGLVWKTRPTEQVLTVCWSACGRLCDRRLHPLHPVLCRWRQGGDGCRRLVAVVLHRNLWPLEGHINWAKVGRRGFCPSLGRLGDPRHRGWGHLGVDPPGRGGWLVGPRHVQLPSPATGAWEGIGGALQGGAPVAQADLRPFEPKAGDAGTGRAIYLLGGDFNGHLGTAGRGCISITTPWQLNAPHAGLRGA